MQNSEVNYCTIKCAFVFSFHNGSAEPGAQFTTDLKINLKIV